MYELIIIWADGDKNVYPYQTEGEARQGERNMRMAFGNQVSWAGVRKSRELCEECRFYPNCDHMTQDDMTELTIKDLETLEQEQDKPMVEIDLYSVIKQKYIEREVLDEIRTEIEEQVLESLSDGGDDWFTAEKVNECLEIIDKYKAESEVKE